MVSTPIQSRIQSLCARIGVACRDAGRSPASVTLLAVTKNVGIDTILEAHACGQTDFGENYVQEAVSKITQLRHLPLRWHCIGPVQGNKAKLVAEHFDWVQTIDRPKIAQRLNDWRPMDRTPLNVCIQVNIDGGKTKSGVAPDQVLALAQAVRSMPRLRLKGLMCIPDVSPSFADACAVFQKARILLDTLNTDGFALDTLSMGMSGDLEAAIASGSTMLRVGTALFGQRT